MQTQPTVETPPRYPVDLVVEYPERSSRWYALLAILLFVKAVLLLPHLVILYFLAFVQLVVMVIGYFAVLFTGRYPRGLFDFVAGVLRWQTRVNAWLFGLTDRYPPFTFR